MNKILIIGLLAVAGLASAAEVPVSNTQLGSGTPAAGLNNITVGVSNATLVDDKVYFTPQYMPGFPTAATLWPRVVQVECDYNTFHQVVCDGYHWTPDLGRGEYLFVTPHMKEHPAPVLVPVPIPVKETITVIREVEVKKGKE